MKRFILRGVSPHLLLLSALFIPFTALANQPEFRGARINITEISRPGNVGDATIHWEVEHSFSTTERFIKKPAGTLDQDSIEEVEGLDLKSVPYTITTHSGTNTIDASRLDCSTAQDICRGCISSTFTVENRTADIENDDPQNRSVKITSRYNVLRSTNGRPAAPNYSGPIMLDLRKGDDLDIDLNSFIDYPGAYSCSLVRAAFTNGLIENPSSSTGNLFITEGCSLRWNVANAPEIEVGNQFNFQLKIKADEKVNQTNCTPETVVDVQIQIGCASDQLSTGDASCFLCSDVDITKPLDDLVLTSQDTMRKLRRSRNRDQRRARRGRGDESELVLKRIRRAARGYRPTIRHFRNFKKTQSQMLALESIQTSCAAASSEFCSSRSNLPELEAIDLLLSQRTAILEGAFRAKVRGSRAIGFKGQKSFKRAERFRDKISAQLDLLENLRALIPSSDDTCGVGGDITVPVEPPADGDDPFTPGSDGESKSEQ